MTATNVIALHQAKEEPTPEELRAMTTERIYDLAFEVLPDGSIELEQGFAEVNRLSLHASHVRHLYERAGYLLSPPGKSRYVNKSEF